jgi:hypothetical protein
VDLDRQRENPASQEKAIDFRRGRVHYGKKRAEMRCVGEENRALAFAKKMAGRSADRYSFCPSIHIKRK